MEVAKILHACATGNLAALDFCELETLPRLRYCRTPLHISLERNHMNIVNRLLELGVDVNEQNYLSRTPIQMACERGYDFEVISDLLNCGVKVTTVEDSVNLLQTACAYCDANVIRKILNMDGVNESVHEACDILHTCAKRGFKDFCRYLVVSLGMKINARSVTGRVPLHEACDKGQIGVAVVLVDNGAVIDAMTDEGITSLALAIRNGNVELVEYLLAGGADLDLVHDPLVMAYTSLNSKLVKLLIDYGCECDTIPLTHLTCLIGDESALSGILRSETINGQDFNGQTLLHISCRKRSMMMVDLCLRYGVNMDRRDKKGETPLHLAVKMGDEKLVTKLLDHGASPLVKDGQESTSLEIACSQGRLDIVQSLMRSSHTVGVDILMKCFENAVRLNHVDTVRHLLTCTSIKSSLVENIELVRHACEQGHSQIVDLLMAENLTDLKHVRGMFPQAITQLCWSGRIDVFQWLWKIGVSVNSRLQDNRTALHFASKYGLPSATHAMLLTGASANVQDSAGITPLHLACANNHLPICKYLITNGALVSMSDDEGLYPVHYAAERGAMELLQYLLDQDADPVFPTKNGSSPLHLAARGGNLYGALELVKNGANPNMKNNLGHTPMNEALLGMFSGSRSRTVLRGKDTAKTVQFTTGLEVLELMLVLGADPCVLNADGKTAMQVFVDHHLNSDKTSIDILDNEISRMTWEILQDFKFSVTDLTYILTRIPNAKKYSNSFLVELIRTSCGFEQVTSNTLTCHIQKSDNTEELLETVLEAGMLVPFSWLPDEIASIKYSKPPCLMHLSRAAIRRILRLYGGRLSQNVENLDALPKSLRNYLLFNQV